MESVESVKRPRPDFLRERHYVNQRLFRGAESDEYYFEEGCYILEYLNDPSDPEASIARARVPPGVTTRSHCLKDTTERYLVVQGHGTAEIGDGPPLTVGPGDVVLIPAGTSQRITNTAEEDLVFLAICTPRFEAKNYRPL